MKKVYNYLLIGDLHLNYRSVFIQNHLQQFNDEYNYNFSNLLRIIQKVNSYKNGYHLVFLGDIIEPIPLNFDFSNLLKLYQTLKDFKNNIYMIVGNHDIYYRNTEKSLLYEFYYHLRKLKYNCFIIEPSMTLQIDKNVYIVGPSVDLKEFLKDKDNLIIFTHQEIHLLNKNDIKNNIIISGHIHNPANYMLNSKKNLYYIGSIIPLNFRDSFSLDDLKKWKKFDFGLAEFNIRTKKFTRLSLNNRTNFYKIFINSQEQLDKIFRIISKSKQQLFIIEFSIPSVKFNYDFNKLQKLNNLIFRIKPISETLDLSSVIEKSVSDTEKFDLIKMIEKTLKNIMKELNYNEEIKKEIFEDIIKNLKTK